MLGIESFVESLDIRPKINVRKTALVHEYSKGSRGRSEIDSNAKVEVGEEKKKKQQKKTKKKKKG